MLPPPPPGFPPPPVDGGAGDPPMPPPPHGDHGPGFPLTPGGRADLAVCRATLKLCLSTSSDAQGCLTAAHQCVHDALSADFAQVCTALQAACAACASSPACTDISARCAAGVPFPDVAK